MPFTPELAFLSTLNVPAANAGASSRAASPCAAKNSPSQLLSPQGFSRAKEIRGTAELAARNGARKTYSGQPVPYSAGDFP